MNVLSYRSLVVHVSKTKDCDFPKSILKSDNVPDHHGFSTKVTQGMGQEIGPKSNIPFRLLINKLPSDPSTVLTCMHDVEKITNEAGQDISILTLDQQLYCVTILPISDKSQ